jgi:hypothetical protein
VRACVVCGRHSVTAPQGGWLLLPTSITSLVWSNFLSFLEKHSSLDILLTTLLPDWIFAIFGHFLTQPRHRIRVDPKSVDLVVSPTVPSSVPADGTAFHRSPCRHFYPSHLCRNGAYKPHRPFPSHPPHEPSFRRRLHSDETHHLLMTSRRNSPHPPTYKTAQLVSNSSHHLHSTNLTTRLQ